MLAPGAGLRLNQGTSARLGVAAGRTLCRLAASVWITHDGAPKDIVIEAGDSYQVASRDAHGAGR